MKADELWDKYNCARKEDFLAALAEYGQAVRDRDAEICKVMDCTDKAPPYRVAPGAEYFRACAAAISREPLP